jgi:hypothetical protein
VLDPADATKIIGVLDWEMCTLGDPLTDLGTALAYWTDPQDPEELREIRPAPTTLPGTLSRAQLVERYASATGLDPGDMTFYLAFARFKVAVIIQQIYYRYAQGLTQDERFAAMPKRIKTLLRASLALRAKRDDMKERSLPVIPHQPLGHAAGLARGFTLDMNEKRSIHKLGRFFHRTSRVTRARTGEPARTAEGKRTLFNP